MNCQFCGKPIGPECSGVLEPTIDPYVSEIYGEEQEVLICSGQYQDCLDDI